MPRSGTEVVKSFRPTELSFDFEQLEPCLREALPDLVAACTEIDVIYRRQQDEAAAELISKKASWPAWQRLAYDMFKGPWDPQANHASLFPGVPDRRPGCSFYPADAAREELEAYLAAHPEQDEALRSPYTVVRRGGTGFVAAPYREVYAQELGRAAAALRRAAAKIKHKGLRSYLDVRASSLLDDRHPVADEAWVRLIDSPLEVVIGPFEVYDDGVLGVKASYEAMLLAVNAEAGRNLAAIEAALPTFAASIPCPSGSRPALGGMAPIVVVDELLAAGDGYAGILASAFNLPNDPGVRGNVGWKQVMIRNVMRAKFDTCSKVIADRVLAEQGATSFDAYFMFVLLHEIVHGLGPAYRADGRSVNVACARHHTPIEEAKADVGSFHLLLTMGGRHGIPRFDQRQLWSTVVGGLFRSIRFGMHEAHGRANLIKFNWLTEHQVIKVNAAGRYELHPEGGEAVIAELLDRLVGLQATGTPEELGAFLEQYGKPTPDLEGTVAGLTDVPIDIIPIFPVYRFCGQDQPLDLSVFEGK